jgi:hypothetical protein
MKTLNIDKNIEAMKKFIRTANAHLRKANEVLYGKKRFYFFAKLPKGFYKLNQ